jgi:outer membrane protein OmpA-like peptidoglycan-associated protein
MKKLYLLIFLFFSVFLTFTSTPVSGQHWLGYANSSYAGTNGMYLNPATMANNKYNLYINLAGFNVNFFNDYLQLNTPYSPWRVATNKVPAEYLDSNGTPDWKDSYMLENLNGKNKNISFMSEVRGPSVLFSIGHKNTIAIGTRVRTAVQILDMNENLARIFRWGTSKNQPAFSGPDGLSYDVLYNQNDFAINVNAFAEYSFTFSRLVMERKDQALKLGITVKRLTGLYSTYFQNNPGSSIVVYDTDSIGLVNSNIEYGYVSENYYTDGNNKPTVGRVLGKDKLGSGWGFDLGFAYEYRPDYKNYPYKMDKVKRYDRSAVKPKFRIAAALTDLGRINYNNPKWVGQRALAKNATVNLGQTDTLKTLLDDFGQEAENANGFDKFNTGLGKLIGFSSSKTSFFSKLPTTLNLQFDYNIQGNFFVNATYVQSLRKKGSIGMRHFSQLSVTPRYERKWIDAAIPIVINNDFRSLNFGMFLRLGPVFAGSDRIGSLLFNTRNLYGMDFYAGICIPIAYKKPRDRDNDMVSDKYDLCPDSAGLVKMHGCPDRDGDGIGDADDKCPDMAGPKSTKGCPDTDGDKITDDMDKCPDVPGKLEFDGCPDTDGDGIVDTADACPDKKGTKQMNGCPDTDGDGIADNEDDCPNEKGTKELKGCPENKPKPQPKDTAVITKKPEKQVLPDNEEKVLKEVFESLVFASGSLEIEPESYPALDNLAKLLNAKKTYLVSIEGHTDNIGDASNNLALSLKRAQAVKKYLMDKGIDGKRIFTEGYGQTRPVASNATPEGRKKNRRVEFLIMRLTE